MKLGTALAGLWLLGAGACSDYELGQKSPSGVDGSGPDDSAGEPVDTGASPDSEATADSASETLPCNDALLAPAGAWAGAATCEPFEFGGWEMVVEHEVVVDWASFQDYLTSPIVLPSEAGPLIWFGVYGDDADAVFALDARTGVIAQQVVGFPHPTGIRALAGAAVQTVGAMRVLGTTHFPDDGVTGESVAVSAFDTKAADVLAVVDATPFTAGLALADLDGEGSPDVALDGVLVRHDGASLATFDTYPSLYLTSVADLRADGDKQVLGSAGIYDVRTGRLSEWDGLRDGVDWRVLQATALAGGSGAAVVLGTDGYVVFRADAGGVVSWRLPYEDGVGAAIAAGDTDGDGRAETCVIADYQIRLVDLDGNVRWSDDLTWSSAGGCAMADLDADGLFEVIELSWDGLRIRAGATGEILAEMPDVVQRAFFWSPPVIADVDLDGSAEIVALGQHPPTDPLRHDRLFVLGAAYGRWAKTRPVWNQWGYDVTSIRDDGTIVSFPFPNWQTYNSFRAQPAHDDARPNLTVAVTDACATACDDSGRIHLAIQVSNSGSVEAPAGSIVTVYTWTAVRGLVPVATHVVAEPIPPRTSLAAFAMEVWNVDWGDRQVVEVVPAGDDECDWLDNREEIAVPDPCGAP